MSDLLSDLRYAVRSLRRQPTLTGAAVLALALGIGGTTFIYSVVDTLLLEPLPFPDGKRLVMVWEENERLGRDYGEVAPAQVRGLQQGASALDAIVPYDWFNFTLTGVGQPEELTGTVVAHDFFDLFGVRPFAGRLFRPEDDRPGAAPVVVLSHEFWNGRFGADPAILGRSLTLSGTPATVVGILPAGFRFEVPADVYYPLAQADDFWDNRRARILRVVGRLAPGASLGRAQAEADVAAAAQARAFPETNAGWTLSVVPAAEGLFQGPVRPTFVALLGAVGFVLLIACADVANLLLARATGRRRELAIRASLGADRHRLIRQLLTESLVLAGAGATLGLLLAAWGVGALKGMVPAAMLRATPRLGQIEIDGSVLGMTGLLVFATAALFGLLPAVRAAPAGLRTALTSEGRSTADSARGRLRAWLVAAEVALALVLTTGAGLMIRSFTNQLLANPGFRPDHVLSFWTSLPQTRYADGSAIAEFQRRALEELRALPGVEAVAGANVLPLSGEGSRTDFTIVGTEPGPEGAPPTTQRRLVSPSYFSVLGVPLLRGRAFDERDGPDGPRVAIVNQALADRHFPGRDPLGQRIVLANDSVPREIVGVVANVADWRMSDRSGVTLYLPFPQVRSARMGFLIRATGAPEGVADAARRTIAALDPDQPIYDVQSLRARRDFSLFPQRMSAAVFAGLAGIALMLAAVGVYGVIAYGVGQRLNEIGVRLALGARAESVVRLVVTQGMRPVVAGVVLGVIGSLALSRALTRLLFGVRPHDPATLASVATLVMLVALVACYLPARRATGVSPVEALRHE